MQKIKPILIFTLFSLLTFIACKKADPCETTLCLNEAICENGSCKCATGYEGTTCNTEMRTKFLGIWNLKSKCEGEDVVNITSAITTGIAVQNIILAAEDIIIQGTISGNTITFEPQITSGALTISGSGIIDNTNTITINLNLVGDSILFTCQWKLTK